MDVLRELKTLDGLREATVGSKPCYIHEDHRWVLPLIHHAQVSGRLPRPCTVIMFDAHHDALVPRALEVVREMAKNGFSAEDLLQLCQTHLASSDDDWVVAGMELGLIKDAIVFGVTYNEDRPGGDSHTDWRGTTHLIWITYSLPGGALTYQGALSDLAKSESLSKLWRALHWTHKPKGVFEFAGNAETILLDIDLDCFTANWRGESFSWPDVVYNAEFNRVSTYWSTQDWSGKRFFDALVERAGIIAIAREPHFCGGEDICNENLAKVSRFLFNEDACI